uniref:Uncharacterized protein n=1 Tax=Anguilla anguilla TaxID=7936 RepID=A0A0E9RD01_ANGAN
MSDRVNNWTKLKKTRHELTEKQIQPLQSLV